MNAANSSTEKSLISNLKYLRYSENYFNNIDKWGHCCGNSVIGETYLLICFFWYVISTFPSEYAPISFWLLKSQLLLMAIYTVLVFLILQRNSIVPSKLSTNVFLVCFSVVHNPIWKCEAKVCAWDNTTLLFCLLELIFEMTLYYW